MSEIISVKNILIIDDHELFNAGFSQLLSTIWLDSSIYTSENTDSGVEILNRQAIDLVFLDINLGSANGKVELSWLAKAYVDSSFVMLSASDSNPDIRFCLDNGARGFIPKNLAVDKLREALEEIRSGHIYTPPCYRHFESGSVMTRQEQVIIKYLKLGKTDKEIAAQLNIAVSTARRHVHNIKKKLNISSRNQIR